MLKMTSKKFCQDNFPALCDAMTFSMSDKLKWFWPEMYDKMVKTCGKASLDSIYLYYGASKDIVQNVPGKILSYNGNWFVLCSEPLDAAAVVASRLKTISNTGARDSLVIEVSRALWGERGAVFESNEGRGAVIFPSPSQQGKFQISYFDRGGFSGHTLQGSVESAIKDAMRDGYRLTDRDLVSEYGRTTEFAEGNIRANIIQTYNELMWKGCREAALDLDNIYRLEGLDVAYSKAKEALRALRTSECNTGIVA